MNKLLEKRQLSDGSMLYTWSLCIAERPIGLIHYFDQYANYLDSVLTTERKELKKYEKLPISKNKPWFRWESIGNQPIKYTFNINTISYPDDEANQVFYGAVKDCFAKREPKVDVYLKSIPTRYSFIVQYLVRKKTSAKHTVGKPSFDLLAK